MPISLFPLILALVVAAFAGPAAAQTMEFDCPSPGTTFTYDSGIKIVVRGREGMDCMVQLQDGKPAKLRALLIDNPSPNGTDTSAFIAALKPERLWPLQVGKKIDADFSADGRKWHYVMSVAKYEKRTGPGEAMIDTFLIEMIEQGDKGERSISRWWISPADKYVIRFDFSDGAGRANRAVVTSVTR